jgi:citrate synthase
MIGAEPNVDFALVAIERSLKLPNGVALALFAIARTVGWLAHVFEQRAAGNLIRPRAEFILE